MGFLKKNKTEDPPPPPPPQVLDEESALTDEDSADSSYGPVPPPPPGVVAEKQAQYDLEQAQAAAQADDDDDDYDDNNNNNNNDPEDDEDDVISMPDKNDPPSQDITMDVSGDEFGGTEQDDEDDQSVEIPPTSIVQRMIEHEKEEYQDKEGGACFGRMTAAIACCLVILAIILGAGFGTGAFTKSSSEAPPPADTDGDRNVPGAAPTSDGSGGNPSGGSGGNGGAGVDDVMLYLASISSVPTQIETEGSAEAAAANFLINEDPLQLGVETLADQFRLSQRYALLTLWFSETDGWDNSEGWGVAEDECTWFGVTCESQDIGGETANVVTKIEMPNNDLDAPLPADLALLEYMTTLK